MVQCENFVYMTRYWNCFHFNWNNYSKSFSILGDFKASVKQIFEECIEGKNQSSFKLNVFVKTVTSLTIIKHTQNVLVKLIWSSNRGISPETRQKLKVWENFFWKSKTELDRNKGENAKIVNFKANSWEKKLKKIRLRNCFNRQLKSWYTFCNVWKRTTKSFKA